MMKSTPAGDDIANPGHSGGTAGAQDRLAAGVAYALLHRLTAAIAIARPQGR